MFYKMCNDLTPSYLSSLVPQSIDTFNLSQYSRRNAYNLQSIHARTNLYFQPFLPSLVRKWNDLSDKAKRSSLVTSFKNYLNRNKTSVPKYIYTGTRKTQILHTCLQTECSSLNSDLYSKKLNLHLAAAAKYKIHTIIYFVVHFTSHRETDYLTLYQNIKQYCLIFYYLEMPLYHTQQMFLYLKKVQKYISVTKCF